MVLDVYFFRLESGREPVREWLKSLDMDAKKSIGEDIRTIQGRWPLGMPLVRKMESNLWEVRANIKEGISRIFFTVESHHMILLHGFVKKTNKTPKSEITLARKRMKEWRGNNE